MHLCIDIGNTRSKWAVFDKALLIEKQTISVLDVAVLQQIFAQYPIDKSISSSVRHEIAPEIKAFLSDNSFYVPFTTDTPLPVFSRYATPQTLGRDRIAGAVAAYFLYPETHSLVLDSGTCLTYNFIDKSATYWGGAISLGVRMRFKSLAHFTARLPLIEPQAEMPYFIGDTTETSILSGVMNGVAQEIDGIVTQYEQSFGKINVVFTGGDAHLLHTTHKKQIFAQPELVFIGLNQILVFNAALFL
ncbi:MAG: type III pantothenate kinase [Chitinophagales bacterium]|nr:type III pantothenate kinase [Chitinophagales bacterium]